MVYTKGAGRIEIPAGHSASAGIPGRVMIPG